MTILILHGSSISNAIYNDSAAGNAERILTLLNIKN